MNNYIPLSDEQSRQQIETQQAYRVWREAARQTWNGHDGEFTARLSWRRVKGREYLVERKLSYQKHLGIRSPETEQQRQNYMAEREAVIERMKSTHARLKQLAPVNRGYRLGRMPRLTADILRQLDEHGLLGGRIKVVGTNALYAYEALAGVHIAQPLMETGDADLLWDSRERLVLRIDKVPRPAVIQLLKRADRSFDVSRQYGIAAENKDGFIVELLAEDTGSIDETDMPGDISVNPMAGMAELLVLKPFEAIGIDRRGMPYRIVVPDIRVFALLKEWVSKLQSRPPEKRRRDREQAKVLRALTTKEMGLSFSAEELSDVPQYLTGT